MYFFISTLNNLFLFSRQLSINLYIVQNKYFFIRIFLSKRREKNKKRGRKGEDERTSDKNFVTRAKTHTFPFVLYVQELKYLGI